jgi:hypothetical protein
MLVARINRRRIGRSVCVSILLLAVITAGCLVIRRNLAAIGADVAGAVLSRALGGAGVRVEEVMVHGIRSLAMSGVQLGDGLSARRMLVTYDFRSLLRSRTNPLLSVTAIRAEGVEADWIALQRYMGRTESASATPADSPRSGSGEGKQASGFAGAISIRDAVVTVDHSGEAGGGKGAGHKVELRDVRLEPLAHGQAPAWSVAVARATYHDPHQPAQSVELADIRGAVALSNDTVNVDDVSARLLGGTVQAAFALPGAAGRRLTADRISGKAVLMGVSYHGWAFTGELATCDDGRIQADGDVSSEHLSARVDGTVAIPGFTPDATSLAAEGAVDIKTMEIGESRIEDMKFRVSAERASRADGGPGDIVIQTRAQKATLEQIAKALGRPIPAQGWVKWSADAKIGPDGRTCVRIGLADGVVRADGWGDELPHEFTDVSGVIEVSTAVGVAAGADSEGAGASAGVREGRGESGKDEPTFSVPGVQARLGGGEVVLSGSMQSWSVKATGVRVDHQVVSGLVDADLALRTGERFALSGRAAVRNALMDLVIAGIQSGVPVPEADLDVDIEVGENVMIVRGESWAWALPGTIHVQGSTRRPTASGSLNLSSGQIDLYGVPLEVMSGGVRFTGRPGDPPEFVLVARDVASELPTIITVDGVPGDMRIAVKPEEGPEKEVPEGDLLVKLLLARLRLYMLSGLGRVLAN